MGSHSVTCHPADVTPPFTPAEASTRFSDTEGITYSWLVTYRDGIPARIQLPIPLLTGPDVG